MSVPAQYNISPLDVAFDAGYCLSSGVRCQKRVTFHQDAHSGRELRTPRAESETDGAVRGPVRLQIRQVRDKP